MLRLAAVPETVAADGCSAGQTTNNRRKQRPLDIDCPYRFTSLLVYLKWEHKVETIY